MKNFKKVLALVLVLATLMGFATVAGAAYKDNADISADYSEAIQVLELIETMEGYPDGTFGPKKTITREEAAKLIAIFDNKDSDISTYYTSINPFADEKGRWGESYVGYGYRAGIIAGMNATTYAPTANVTGTQFLKMALVTLGYDQEAEGFVGSSWAVNVLALARKLDLIDGLADGWKAEKDLTREEAAQILLNTLKADTVEYAQEAKQVGFKPTATKNTAGTEVSWTWGGRIYLTVAGAVSTGKPLYDGFGLKKSTSFDAFMRPYVKWTLGKDSVEVMEAPKATFTKRFSACDLLAELGVKKTDTKTVIVIDGVYNDGVLAYNGGAGKNAEALMTGNGDDYKISEEYVTRPADGSKHGSWILDKDFGIWSHENSTCKNPTDAKHGAQGTLTQVFYNGKDSEGNKHYYVTSIETWLAKVKSVTTKTTSRDEHTKKDGAVKIEEVYTQNYKTNVMDSKYNFPGYRASTADAGKGETGHDNLLKGVAVANLTYDDPTGIEKGDYVLLTYSFKENRKNASGYEGIQSLDVVEGKDGKLNGSKYGTVADPSETRVDGEYIKDSVHFALGYDLSKSKAFDTYTFFYDAYGNVIGMKEAKDASGWGVADRMWIATGEKGAITFNGDIVGLDGETKTAEIDSVNHHDVDGEDYAYGVAAWLQNKVNGLSYKDFAKYYDHLFKFSTNSKGEFVWNMGINGAFQAETGTASNKVHHFGELTGQNKLDSEIKLNGKAYMEFNAKTNVSYSTTQIQKVALSSDTQILVHNMDGTYSEYTGYKSVPAMIAHYVEWVMDDDNEFAEVVYLTNDVYTTDSKFTAYVGSPADESVIFTENEKDYYALDVYVGKEKKTVYVETAQKDAYFDEGTLDNAKTFKQGIYEFQYLKVDGDEIVRVVKGPHTSAAADFTGNSQYLSNAATVASFNTKEFYLTGADDTVYTIADDCAVYAITRDGEIEDKDMTLDEIDSLLDETVDPVDGAYPAGSDYQAHQIFFKYDDDKVVSVLYFVLARND